MECTIFQRYNNVPLELSVVEWRAMVAPKYSVYVPFYPMLINETPEAYRILGTKDTVKAYNPKSAYFAFQGVKEKCYADPAFAKKVMENYAKIEAYINAQFIEDQKTLFAKYSTDKSGAKAYATELGKKYSDVAIAAANALYDGKEVTVPTVEKKALYTVDVPKGSNVSVSAITEITDAVITAGAQTVLDTLANDLKKAGFDVLPDTFRIFDIQATGSGKVKIAVGKEYAGKIALVGHLHDGKWTVQQCKVDKDGNIYPEFKSFSPVFVEMTSADKEVALSVEAEPTLAKKSPKTGETSTDAILVLMMMATVCGLALTKKRA